MAKQIVLVVHAEFDWKGKRVSRGTIISDPAEIDFIRRTHPEKATASYHDFAEPEPGEEMARVDHGQGEQG